ncbi:MAG: hypothetical protein FWD69_15155 [Polyangiaceae bacterium]|nr:hypothetical protein [Polyangiaceae bacterium]
MEDGSYFFFEDKDYQRRQSLGGLFVYNKKVDENIYLYCMEYDAFWRDIKDHLLSGDVNFKKPLLSPVPLNDLMNSRFKGHINGVVHILRGRVDCVVRF